MVWVKFVGFILIIIFVVSLVNAVLRKIFKIEKEKKAFFPFNYTNKLHRKIDISINIIAAFVYIFCFYLIVFKGYSVNIFLVSVILFTILDHSVQAIFEWKYSQNPKKAVLTISEMSLVVIAIILTIQFDLFSLLIF
ncbi:hypothetical protein AJGP001_16855 [Planococcus faecalis]|uniref:DUF4181 domain-containing protein n=2 Tax=Planococcus faecalis TaxID=1598147 RepID=A0ABM6IWD5_9BACL|nr:hypothetical protein AJGP001_16855 [Planococcus faecalis]OHX55836.1 hypothetical protein BB777_01430 [Planococcus faecalis]